MTAGRAWAKMGGWRIMALDTGTSAVDRSLACYLSDPVRRPQAVVLIPAGGTYCIAGDALVTNEYCERGP